MFFYQHVNPPIKLSRYKSLPSKDKLVLVESLRRTPKLVEVISYVFMPNHFHFVLKQVTDAGISKFVSQFTNSYTRYFNTRTSRPGILFQGPFKAVHIETENQLLHLSRYLHLNPYVSSVVTKDGLSTYQWSSYPDYLRGYSDSVNLQPVTSHFKSPTDYQAFVLDHSGYARELEQIKHQLIEID
jgi:putative transposase